MLYWLIRLIAFVVLKVFFKLKIEGKEFIPQKTNFIVVANHSSFLDPFIVSVALPQKVSWISLNYFQKFTLVNWILRHIDSIPTGSSSEKALSLLMKKENVGLFPEGTRSHDGKIREFKRGAALLAIKTGRPILPCAIIGAYEAYPRSAKFPKFRPIKVKFARPRYLFKEFDAIIDDIYLQEGAFKIRKTIKEMIDAEQ